MGLTSRADRYKFGVKWVHYMPLEMAENKWVSLLGCPWKLVTIVSKLGYNLPTGLTIYLYRGYNPFTKYHGHPSSP